MKIYAQSDIIESILEALQTNIFARELASRCSITHSMDDGYNAYIKFEPHSPVDPQLWFWLGYYAAK